MTLAGLLRRSRQFAALLITVATIAASTLAGSGSARAHASLVAADPSADAIVAEKPAVLSLTFNEPVSPLALKLVAPDGSVSELARPTLEGSTLLVPPPATMPAGTYVFSWRVVSLDGHPVGGTVVFSIGHASAGSPPPDGVTTVDRPVRGAIWLARVLIYAGLFLGVGASLSRTLIAPLPPAARSFAIVVSCAGLVGAAVSVGLQGLDALDAPLSAFLHAAIWQAGFSTTYGITATIGALALLVGIGALTMHRGRAAALLSLAAIAGVGLALAASGHASNAAPQWLMRPAVFLHAVTTAFWIGALPPLALTLGRGGEGAALALARFSRLIPFAIAPLVLSGLALAIVQIGAPAGLTGTAYGRVLLAKLALVAALFGLAAWNRWWLTERAIAADPVAVRSLVRSIVVETVLVVAILGVVGVWRFTPPPRALVEVPASSVKVHLHGEKAMALLSLSPGRAGRVTASIAVMTEGAEPLEPSEVTLVVAKAESGVEAISRPAHKLSDGTWQVDGLLIPLAGEWTARVEILVGEFRKIRLEGPVEIGP